MDKEREQMTDEQIEQALKNRAYEISYGDHNDKWIIPKDRLSQETLSYIERLKDACNSAIRSFTRMETLYKVKCTELETAKKQAVRRFVKELRKRIDKIRHPNECVTTNVLEEEYEAIIDDLLAEVTEE